MNGFLKDVYSGNATHALIVFRFTFRPIDERANLLLVVWGSQSWLPGHTRHGSVLMPIGGDWRATCPYAPAWPPPVRTALVERTLRGPHPA